MTESGLTPKPLEKTTEIASLHSSAQTELSDTSKRSKYSRGEDPKLRYIKPYWWAYKTFVKER